MTTATLEPETSMESAELQRDFAQELRDTHAAVKLSCSAFGARKTLDKSQKARAADVFGTDSDSISASKRLIDTKHEAYKAVTAAKAAVVEYWKRSTLPYEDGVRLIRRERIAEFEEAIAARIEELTQAAQALDTVWFNLRDDARRQLGELFNDADYPYSVADEFSASVDYPNIGEPPAYLRSAGASVYRRAQDAIRARFENAVSQAEQAFLSEFSGMIRHLADKINGIDDGSAKRVCASSVENLREFFDRFRELNIGSNQDLESLVDEAQRVLRGIDMEDIRHSRHIRESVRESMQQIETQVASMLETRPARVIRR